MTGGAARLGLRLLVGGFQTVRRGLWFITRPPVLGAHAIPITPQGTIVLVKLRYARGWRLPGGGRKAEEEPGAAAIRELREEIGMLSFSDARHVADFDEVSDFRPDSASLFLVRDVEYRPRWSLEVEEVGEFPLDHLPPDTSTRTLRWLETAAPRL